MNKANIFEFHYKDSHRDWWKISFKQIPSRKIHKQWEYEVSREEVQIYSGIVQGQYELVPTLDDFLEDFHHYIGCVIIGFAKYG